MSVMLSHYPPSPLRSSSPSSPSPRRVRSNPPQSRPSSRAMSNLQVNSTVTPGLLSLSRPPPSNQRSKPATAKSSKSDQQLPRPSQPKLVPTTSSTDSKPTNASTASSSSKPTAPLTTTSSSSDAIPQPTVPQVPTPGKQRRTRRPKRSNSDPLFPTPSSPKENQPDLDTHESTETKTATTSNPPRTPGPSTTPSGKGSSPPRPSTSDQSLGPNTPTPASKSVRARGGGGGGRGRNEKSTTSTTLVAQPTPIPSSRAPPEADPNEHLYHSAPSESSFMLGPEPAAPSGDGKRSRGRSGNKASKKKEGSGGSGREDAFVLDEEEGKVWDMPLEKKGTDQLTWQQSLVSSSSTSQFNSISSPTNNRRSSPAPRNARATLSSVPPQTQAQTTSQHRHTASLTWQQALLPTLPPSSPSSNSAPSTMRRRNSLSISGLSLGGPASISATSMRMDESSKHRHPMPSVLATPTKTTAIMPKEDAVGGRAGPRYAGGTFQNSPMAGDLPKPRFGGRM